MNNNEIELLTEEDKDYLIYVNNEYIINKIDNNKTVINNTFTLHDKLGQGSFWNCFKVNRYYSSENYIDNKFYVFKEGDLNKSDYEIKYGSCISLTNQDLVNNINDHNEKTLLEKEDKIAVREYLILKQINYLFIARLYEVIFSKENAKAIFVMEYCDIGNIMSENNEFSIDKSEGLYYKCNDTINKKYFTYNFNLFDKAYNQKLINKEEYDDLIKNKLNINFKINYSSLIKIAYYVFKQLVLAVKLLHNVKYIAHRDIKIDNILLKLDSYKDIYDKYKIFDNTLKEVILVKLTDFSISRQYNNKNIEIDSSQGTALFFAPERNEEYEHNPFKTDIYNIGTCLYTFLFNFSENDSFDIFDLSNISLETKQNLDLLKSKSSLLYKILLITLNKNPANRANIEDLVKLFYIDNTDNN